MKVSVNSMTGFVFNLVGVINTTPPCPESAFNLHLHRVSNSQFCVSYL